MALRIVQISFNPTDGLSVDPDILFVRKMDKVKWEGPPGVPWRVTFSTSPFDPLLEITAADGPKDVDTSGLRFPIKSEYKYDVSIDGTNHLLDPFVIIQKDGGRAGGG